LSKKNPLGYELSWLLLVKYPVKIILTSTTMHANGIRYICGLLHEVLFRAKVGSTHPSKIYNNIKTKTNAHAAYNQVAPNALVALVSGFNIASNDILNASFRANDIKNPKADVITLIISEPKLKFTLIFFGFCL
jgi:hypothetical protein